ncbi:MAG: glucose-6-phosphate isomerase [Phycisphaerae bacterium]|nr:glucose-6-phosphate isomerase [Phycisphaerae bacterium]
MLTIDFANCLSDRVGSHGLDPSALDPSSEAAASAASLTRRLAATRGKGWERWRDLPHGDMRRDHLRDVAAIAARCKGKFDNLVVLGIGGSALGNIALQAALHPATYNLLPDSLRPGPRVFVVDNVDPAHFKSVLAFCEASPGGLQRTLFNVVSKSGETAETAAQFMVIRDLLKRRLGPNYKSNVVAVTDPKAGTMRKICDAEGLDTLPVPEGVGGRFSVLSPVGLFSAAMAGIDIAALLDGAAAMDSLCSKEQLLANPAALIAFLLVELGTSKGKCNHVMMPYSNNLYLLADWFRQLWAESLGKEVDLRGDKVYAGFTPIKALGTTDQHSQVQLYREGPNDKAFCLLEVESFGDHDLTIPTGLGVDAIKYLEGKSMAALLNAEKRATEYALVESQRPNFTIKWPRIDAHHVGQFIYLWEVVTAYAGLMLNIDAYNQPAVETGKIATFGLMGRAGYEKHKAAVERTLGTTKWVV